MIGAGAGTGVWWARRQAQRGTWAPVASLGLWSVRNGQSPGLPVGRSRKQRSTLDSEAWPPVRCSQQGTSGGVSGKRSFCGAELRGPGCPASWRLRQPEHCAPLPGRSTLATTGDTGKSWPRSVSSSVVVPFSADFTPTPSQPGGTGGRA